MTVNVQVAAFANRMFVAAACRCADERGVSWVGGSIIAGPDGFPLAGPASVGGVAGCDGAASSELLVARLRSRAGQEQGDRRPELYRTH